MSKMPKTLKRQTSGDFQSRGPRAPIGGQFTDFNFWDSDAYFNLFFYQMELVGHIKSSSLHIPYIFLPSFFILVSNEG